HSTEIVAAADRPLEETWWATADDPWRFLAFCFEWQGLLSAHERGERYVSHLPCAMDGSCNGLQHFAALFRDEEGGRAVNVTPNPRPRDVYQMIADAVLAMLESESAAGS